MGDERSAKTDAAQTAEIMRIVEDALSGGAKMAVRPAVLGVAHDDAVSEQIDALCDDLALSIESFDLEQIGRIKNDLQAWALQLVEQAAGAGRGDERGSL